MTRLQNSWTERWSKPTEPTLPRSNIRKVNQCHSYWILQWSALTFLSPLNLMPNCGNHCWFQMQKTTYMAEIHNVECASSETTSSSAAATCFASGLEITFESLPQTIDIRWELRLGETLTEFHAYYCSSYPSYREMQSVHYSIVLLTFILHELN